MTIEQNKDFDSNIDSELLNSDYFSRLSNKDKIIHILYEYNFLTKNEILEIWNCYLVTSVTSVTFVTSLSNSENFNNNNILSNKSNKGNKGNKVTVENLKVWLSRLFINEKIKKDESTRPIKYYLDEEQKQKVKLEWLEHKNNEERKKTMLQELKKREYDLTERYNFWSDFVGQNYVQGNEFFVDVQKLITPEIDFEHVERFFDNPEAEIFFINQVFKKEYDKENIKIGVKGKKNKDLKALKELRRITAGSDFKKLFFVECEVDFKTDILSARKFTKFECPSCGNVTNVINPEILREKHINTPICSCGAKGMVEIKSDLEDYQKLIVRDLDINLLPGEQPVQKHAIIRNAFLNPLHERKLNIGDKVMIIGYNKDYFEQKNDVQAKLYIEILGYEFLDKLDYEKRFNDDEIQQFKDLANTYNGLEIFAKNVFSHHDGNFMAKILCTLQLFSAFRVGNERQSINVLLFGEPGTGKTSNFLHKIKTLYHRSSYISSDNNTKAGLSVSSRKDDFLGNYVAELGAIPRANKGYLLVDELNDMDKDFFSSMIEAMETGSVSVNKTGVKGQFPADIRVLATMNPKTVDNMFLPKVPLFDQPMDLKGKFIDRFDFVIPFVDNTTLEQAFRFSTEKQEIIREYTDEFLLRYVLYAETIEPVIPKQLEQKFIKVFLELGKLDAKRQAKHRIIRKCKNLIKAIAKFHLSNVVTEEHISLAGNIYQKYLSLVDNFDQSENIHSFGNLFIKSDRQKIKDFIRNNTEFDITTFYAFIGQENKDAINSLLVSGTIAEVRPNFFKVVE